MVVYISVHICTNQIKSIKVYFHQATIMTFYMDWGPFAKSVVTLINKIRCFSVRLEFGLQDFFTQKLGIWFLVGEGVGYHWNTI